MQEGGNKPDGKRVAITSVTTVFLFGISYTEISEKLFFLVPPGVEILAGFGFLIWAWRKISNNKKMKLTASRSLRKSIEDEIEKTKIDIQQAPTKTIAKLLEKQLAELYKENREESAVHRKNIREDIQRYDNNEQLLQAERESIQANLVQKVEEQVEKAAEFLDKPKPIE